MFNFNLDDVLDVLKWFKNGLERTRAWASSTTAIKRRTVPTHYSTYSNSPACTCLCHSSVSCPSPDGLTHPAT